MYLLPVGVPAHTPPESRYTPPGRYTPRAGTHPLPRQVHPQQVQPPGRYTPLAGTPSRQVHPPSRYTPRQVPPLRAGIPPPSRRLLLRTVRILLECILVRTVHHIKIHRTVILAVEGKFEVNKKLITNN